MNLKFVTLSLVIMAFGLSGLYYDLLPEQIPMHWNIRGEVDNYDPKQPAIWFLPLMVTVMYVMFKVLPSIDPKKDNYLKFTREWEVMQLLMIGFMVYTHATVLHVGLNPQVDVLPWVFMGMGVLFGAIGYLLPRIKQNFFVGIKTPWTLVDEDNWNKTHRIGGISFLVAGAIFIVQAIWPMTKPVWVFLAAVGAGLVPIAYSLWQYKTHRQE